MSDTATMFEMTSYRLELWRLGFLAPNHVVHPLRSLQALLRARGADPQVIAAWRASTVPGLALAQPEAAAQ